jgi:hypothetical protein
MNTKSVRSELDSLLSLVNRVGNEPERKYPEIGYYYAMSAYGGSKLVQIINDGGGVRDVLPHLGYAKRGPLMTGIRSFLVGRSEAAEEQRRQIPESRAMRVDKYAMEVQS